MVIENREPPDAEEPYTPVALHRISGYLEKSPDGLRLSRKTYAYEAGDPWGFRVIEEAADHQIIELHHANTQRIKTRYRVDGRRVTPLSYKTDGGIVLTVYLFPVFMFGMWLGLVAARRSTRWVPGAMDALRKGESGPVT